MAPMNAPDTFLINIAKFKSHQMGITASIKNLQGITGKKFHQFCGGHFDIFKSYDKRYHQFFQPDYMARIAELHKKHFRPEFPDGTLIWTDLHTVVDYLWNNGFRECLILTVLLQPE